MFRQTIRLCHQLLTYRRYNNGWTFVIHIIRDITLVNSANLKMNKLFVLFLLLLTLTTSLPLSERTLHWSEIHDVGSFSHFLRLKALKQIAILSNRTLILHPFHSVHHSSSMNINFCQIFNFSDILCKSTPPKCSHSISTSIDVTSLEEFQNSSQALCFNGIVYSTKAVSPSEKLALSSLPPYLTFQPFYYDVFNFVIQNFESRLKLSQSNYIVIHWRRDDQLETRCKPNWAGVQDTSLNCLSAQKFVQQFLHFLSSQANPSIHLNSTFTQQFNLPSPRSLRSPPKPKSTPSVGPSRDPSLPLILVATDEIHINDLLVLSEAGFYPLSLEIALALSNPSVEHQVSRLHTPASSKKKTDPSTPNKKSPSSPSPKATSISSTPLSSLAYLRSLKDSNSLFRLPKPDSLTSISLLDFFFLEVEFMLRAPRFYSFGVSSVNDVVEAERERRGERHCELRHEQEHGLGTDYHPISTSSSSDDLNNKAKKSESNLPTDSPSFSSTSFSPSPPPPPPPNSNSSTSSSLLRALSHHPIHSHHSPNSTESWCELHIQSESTHFENLQTILYIPTSN